MITLKALVAGLVSTFPAWSVARTRKLWDPGLTVRARGEVQGAKAAASSLHSSVAPASLEKAKLTAAVFCLGFLSFSLALGPLVMELLG